MWLQKPYESSPRAQRVTSSSGDSSSALSSLSATLIDGSGARPVVELRAVSMRRDITGGHASDLRQRAERQAHRKATLSHCAPEIN